MLDEAVRPKEFALAQGIIFGRLWCAPAPTLAMSKQLIRLTHDKPVILLPTQRADAGQYP